jgi:hypothetical protein
MIYRLFLGVLARPRGDQLIDLGRALAARRSGFVARVADQVLALDRLQEAPPMIGIGAAGRRQGLRAGRPRLELGEIHHLDAFETVEPYADLSHCPPLPSDVPGGGRPPPRCDQPLARPPFREG